MTPPVQQAVPAEVERPELTAKDKRKLRERVRREVEAEFAEAERERLRGEVAKKTGAAPPAKQGAQAAAPTAAPTSPVTAERTDADRARDCAVFLRGVLFPLLALVARPLGYALDLSRFSEPAALEDAKAWVPVLRLYPWFDRLVAWVSAPARVVARVRELAKAREQKEPAA